MALFDSLMAQPDTQTDQKNLTKVEGFIGVLLAAAMADGNISDEESTIFTSFLIKNKQVLQAAFSSGGNASDFVNDSLEKLSNMYIRQGSEPFVDDCVQALPSDWKKPTFTMLAELMFADGSPCRDNIATLNHTYQKLGISSEEALSIVNVIKQLHYFD